MAQVRVGVAAVVADGERWLVMHRHGSRGAGTWGLPGGHQEFGESPERTATREVAEETGLTVVATARLGFTDDPMPEIGRHYELEWLTPAELRGRDKCRAGPV